MKHKTFILTLIFFFLFSFPIFAQPPGQTLGPMGILYPKIEYIPQGENSRLHIHGFAETGELLNPTAYNCYVHIYNSQNMHLIEDEMGNDANGLEKEFIINSTITYNIGTYSYNIWCNSTNEAGAVSEFFSVTPDGYDLNLGGDFDYLAIILIIIFITFMSFKISEMFVSKEFFGLKIIFFIWGVLQVILVLPIFLLTISSYASPTAMFDWFVVYFAIDIFLLIIFVLGYWLIVGGHIILFFTKIAKRQKPKQIKYQ